MPDAPLFERDRGEKSKNFYEIGEYNDEEAGIQSISAAE